MGKYIVGLDEGTTGCKACVFDFDGNILGSDYKEYPCIYIKGKPSYVEQRADSITPALFDCVKAAISKSGIKKDSILAIGLSSQGAVIGMVDSKGLPLHNFISWQDGRGAEMTDEMLNRISEREYYNITGWNINNSILPVAKHLWLQKHKPKLYEKTSRFVTNQEYFLKQFGADGWYVDSSSICREALGDVDNHDYSQRIFDLFNMDIGKRGKRVPNGTVVGEVGTKVSELTGLPVGCKICVGAMDSDCSPFGCGLIRPNDTSIVMGTYGACFICSEKPIRDPNDSLLMVKSHTYFKNGPNTFTIEGGSPASASAYRWFRDNFGTLELETEKKTGVPAYELMAMQAKKSSPGANGVTFLPFLQGRMGGKNNPYAKGALIGMRMSTRREDMLRAVMEGICFEIKETLIAQTAANIHIGNIHLTGGAAKSPFWVQMQANIYQKPITVLETTENGCLGAAMFAGVGIGAYKDAYEAVERAVRKGKTYTPNLNLKDVYEDAYLQFESAYSGLLGRG